MRAAARAALALAVGLLAPSFAAAQGEPLPSDDGLPGFVIDPPGWLGWQFQVAVLPARGSTWLTEFNDRRISANQLGAGILLGWSALHVIGGGVGASFVEDDRWRAFLQADAAVSAVALGSAVAGLIVASRIDPADLSYSESLRKGRLLERLLLVGIGLDLAAVTGGAALWALGDTDQLVGFGQGLALQGAALLLFDTALLLLNLKFEERLLVVLDRPLGDVLRLGIELRF
ncbi:MAG: DUF6992 family protein [Myxococcales bacterium]|jgi:hypothetical protein